MQRPEPGMIVHGEVVRLNHGYQVNTERRSQLKLTVVEKMTAHLHVRQPAVGMMETPQYSTKRRTSVNGMLLMQNFMLAVAKSAPFETVQNNAMMLAKPHILEIPSQDRLWASTVRNL